MNLVRSSLVALTFTVSGALHAAGPANGDAARAQYEAEKARCMSGTTGQTQASCLRSAGAAYDSAKSGRLADPNTNFRQNAMTRCQSLSGADRADCEARVNAGVPAADVKAGGSVQETVTTYPLPAGTAK